MLNVYYRSVHRIKNKSQSFKCKVGAILVKDNKIKCRGYNHNNGKPLERHSCCGVDAISNHKSECYNCGKSYKLVTKQGVVHAEIDVLETFKSLFGKEALAKATMYISRAPCEECNEKLKHHRVRWEVLV